jgi:hypothetical protein
MWLRKQAHRFCTWETELTFEPTSEYTEAGTVCWWNYFTYSTIGIRKRDNSLVLRFQPSEGQIVERLLSSSTVVLVVDCGNEYRFGYRDSTDHTEWIGSVSNKAATRAPPVGAPFTGKTAQMIFSSCLLKGIQE